MTEETADVFNAMRRDRQERHQDWHRKNMAELERLGLSGRVTNNGQCVVFSSPRADFYPSTGRWRSEGKTYSGGAGKFSAWYKAKRLELLACKSCKGTGSRDAEAADEYIRATCEACGGSGFAAGGDRQEPQK